MNHKHEIEEASHNGSSFYIARCETCGYFADCESYEDAEACIEDHIENSE